MSKKRNRQGDFNGEFSDDSTDSSNESSTTGTNCMHVTKALNFTKIKKSINKEGMTKECSTCKKYEINEEKLKNDTNSEEQPNILICLQCGHQGCGKEDEGHAFEHYKKPFSDCHSMAVETTNWSVWCFQCGMKVNIANRKKLQESVDFIKKSLAVKSLQTKIVQAQNQKEMIDVDEKEKKGSDSFPKVGGLINMGNTCFFNAVLQCLAQTPFLVKVLDDLRLPGQEFTLPGGKLKLPNSEEEIELPPIKGTLEGWGTFTSILSKVLIDMQNTDGSQPYRPSELLNSFKKKNMQCMDGGQHDSHELLRHLLEIARNEDLRRYQSIILKEVGLNGKTNPEDVENTLKSRVKFYGNQASSRLLGPEPVFRGVLVSTLECLDCGHTSHNSEQFLDLSLPVIADKPQPPILRKNNGNEDSFDMTGNVITNNTPSKHQLKKEKKAARKNRKNKRDGTLNSHDGINNWVDKSANNEENNDMNESEESDADVEDNTETEIAIPEVGESGYSSEKQSTLPSPASPSNESVKANEDSMKTNEYPLRAREDLLKHERSMGTSEDSLKMNDYSVKTEAETIKLRESSIKRIETALHYTEISMNNPENGSLLQTIDTNNMNANFSDTKNLEPLKCFEMTENGNNAGRILPLCSNLDDHLALNLSLDNPSSRITSLTLYNPNEDRSIMSGNNVLLIKNKEKEEDDEEEETAYNKQWKIRRKLDSPIEINSITFGIAKMGINSNLKTCLRDAPACLDEAPTRYPTKEGECSIQSCLNQFTALELMTGSNKVGCEACTQRETKAKNNNADTKMVCTPSTKQYLISKVPAVLILHLKRFQAQRVDFRKVTRHVSFPILLDLAPICKNHRKPRIYALYGVVEHSGTIHGGHYVAYVKSRLPLAPDDPRWSFLPSKDENEASTPESGEETRRKEEDEEETDEAIGDNSVKIEPPPGKWYYISDSQVTEVDEATVLRRQAYLLFYERIL
ncbi:ubiquitin carboxyl-terminal hydrolase 16 isoform X2 [Ceratina calcarata]|uniref:Ubiquitin carboxyl-terminal hydrolase n=1 Tax=Ceratina calcarata TaxID=156304 RepID=A0AAJ7J977_9HYME|nr:ubiquitin carboxyl-terminal hydrolase 16 isoform X2 [Ceratina calcarata]